MTAAKKSDLLVSISICNRLIGDRLQKCDQLIQVGEPALRLAMHLFEAKVSKRRATPLGISWRG